MKRVLLVVLVALLALGFAMAQEQTVPKGKATTTQTTMQKKQGCCCRAKECVNMKDCPATKGTTEAKTPSKKTTTEKQSANSTDTKPAEAK